MAVRRQSIKIYMPILAKLYSWRSAHPVRKICFYGLAADRQLLHGGGAGRQPTKFAPGAIERRYATD